MSTHPQPKTETESQVSLKLVIDKKKAENSIRRSRQELHRLLFTILSLPLGTVVKLLSTDQGQGMPMKTWSLPNLYRSVETLDVNYFESNPKKDNLLNPKLPSTTQSQLGNLLQIQSSSPPTTYYYTCSYSINTTGCRYSFSATKGAVCPRCSKSMISPAIYVYGANEARPPAEGGYVKGGLVTYMVMDDLTVKPISSSMSTLSVLNQLRVEDVAQVEEQLVYLDINECVKLLKASLQSSAALTDVFFHKINFQTAPGTKRKKALVRIEDDEDDDHPIIYKTKRL